MLRNDAACGQAGHLLLTALATLYGAPRDTSHMAWAIIWWFARNVFDLAAEDACGSPDELRSAISLADLDQVNAVQRITHQTSEFRKGEGLTLAKLTDFRTISF